MTIGSMIAKVGLVGSFLAIAGFKKALDKVGDYVGDSIEKALEELSEASAPEASAPAPEASAPEAIRWPLASTATALMAPTSPGLRYSGGGTFLDPQRPFRTSWRDFPPEYIEALKQADAEGEARIGPMSWNDARFSQREFYRLVACLRRNSVEGDTEAAALDQIARKLRVSGPRCEEDLTKHWFVLKANPLWRPIQAGGSGGAA
jgi:hypothetical protein